MAGTVACYLLFLALVTFALVATDGNFLGGAIRDGVPSNFVFVGLIQALLCAWLLAAVVGVFESKVRETKLGGGTALLRALFGTRHPHDAQPVTCFQLSIIAAVRFITRDVPRVHGGVTRILVPCFPEIVFLPRPKPKPSPKCRSRVASQATG